MRNTVPSEFGFVVLGLVQANHSSYIKMLKNLKIVLWSITPPFKLINIVQWPHESNELAWDNPIEIAILNFFVVLILFIVKFLELIPSKLYSEFKTLKAMLNSALVTAFLGITCVSEGYELLVVWLEELPNCRCLCLQDYDHESSHKKRCIGLFIELIAAIMKKAVIFVLWVSQKPH